MILFLQRIAQAIRNTGPVGVKLERFKEALDSGVTGLTYAALTGQRKQSVTDAERLLSPFVLRWMEGKGYEEEAKLCKSLFRLAQVKRCQRLDTGRKSTRKQNNACLPP